MRFIALNKKNESSIGDAFYFETVINNEIKNALVDGGKEIKGFTDLLESETGIDKIDIVACTHDDADHTYGIIDLLKNTKRIEIKELWLPLSWMQLEDVINEYQGDVNKFKEDLKNPRIYKFIKRHREYKASFEEEIKFEDEIYHIDSTDEINEVSGHVSDKNAQFLEKLEKEVREDQEDQEISEVITKVYHTLNNIFTIANLALKNGVKIKWLEYQEIKIIDTFKYMNEPLIPLNSKEVFRIRKKSEPLLYLLKIVLSKVNAESLVFSSNHQNYIQRGKVLFTSDSNLEKNELLNFCFKRNSIITVPHHGSKNNYDAFNRIEKILKKSRHYNEITWVCGQNSAVTLGNWYLNDAQLYGEKYCTLCEGQSLKFILSAYDWQVYHSLLSSKCNCL